MSTPGIPGPRNFDENGYHDTLTDEDDAAVVLHNNIRFLLAIATPFSVVPLKF